VFAAFVVVVAVTEFVMTLIPSCAPDANLWWGEQWEIVESRIDYDASASAYAVIEWNLPWNREADIGYWSQPVLPWIVYTDCFETAPDDLGQYHVKVDVVEVLSGDADALEVLYDHANVGVWVDMFDDGGYFPIELYHSDIGNGVPNHQIIDIHIAPDDGSGNPLECAKQTRRAEIIAYAGDDEFIVYDNFTGTNGTNLTAHSPDKDYTGNGWSVSTGTWALNGGGEAQSSNATRYVADAYTADHEVAAEFQFYQHEAGLIGRYQDSSNYWELRVSDLDTTDPTLELIKVVAGTPTVVATATYADYGVTSNTTRLKMRLRFEGNVILGAIEFGWPLVAPAEITATDSTFNTETEAGLFAAAAGVQVNRFSIAHSVPGFEEIVWDDTPLTSTVVDTPSAYNNLYFYETANGKTSVPYHSSMGYWNAGVVDNVDVIHENRTPFSTGDYVVKYTVHDDTTGHASDITLNYSTGNANTWVDLYRANISFDSTTDEYREVFIDVTVAKDNGAGNPVSGTEVTKRIRMITDDR
jgi:hypothetical protein